MSKDEALKMAGYDLDGVIADVEKFNGFDDVCLQTIKRVRSVIAEALNLSEKQYTFPDKNIPAQEPVAWLHIDGDSTCTNNTKKYGGVDKGYSIPLDIRHHQDGTSPSETKDKEFVTLTDDEIVKECAVNFSVKLHEVKQPDIDLCRAIEQALKEKNT